MANFTSICSVVLNMDVVSSIRFWEDGEECYLQVLFIGGIDSHSFFIKDSEKAKRQWQAFIDKMEPPLAEDVKTATVTQPSHSEIMAAKVDPPTDPVVASVLVDMPEPIIVIDEPEPPRRKRKKGDWYE